MNTSKKVYLSITEASKKYGKSVSTIRRLIRDIEAKGKSKKQLKQIPHKTGFKYLVSDKLLNKTFGGIHEIKKERKATEPVQRTHPTKKEPVNDDHQREIEYLKMLLEQSQREKDQLYITINNLSDALKYARLSRKDVKKLIESK